ncbi:hypothetical protein TWF788_006750 [Orbilia oligospora]|uniref:Uncharacterized protein n=1 Tax=Orbilia oligospora TaxID=2813651 RepID=A0A7C8TU76_ORBOL|nr:hypothetical protein TWF788_006750 [Orbilia oligospora]
MISGVLISTLKAQQASVLQLRNWRTLNLRRTVVSPRIPHLQHRHLRQKSIPVAANIISEFRKANVRCTPSGEKIFKQTYAKAPANTFSCSWELYSPLWTTTRGEDTPDSLCYRNLNVSSARQWRSRQAYDICISFKVYKVWEALYTNSNIFRQLIDDQEKDCRNFSRCCMALQPLWLWLKLVVEEGLVERGDVDQLPEPSMLRDVVIGSGDPPDAVDLGLVNPAMCH